MLLTGLKPSGDAANRNYRRRSPLNGPSSPDVSPENEQNLRSDPSREDFVRFSEHHSRKDDDREQEAAGQRNQKDGLCYH